MALEHVSIPDGQRHEPKGADSAGANEFMVANGSGGTSWRPLVFNDIVQSLQTNISEEAQNILSVPEAIDDQADIFLTFDGSTSSQNNVITINQNGSTVVTEDGVYYLSLTTTYEKNNVGIATVAGSVVVNGVPYGASQLYNFIRDEDQGGSDTHNINAVISLNAGDVLQYRMRLVNGTGVSLSPVTVDLTGWNAIPSASLTVRKIDVVDGNA